MKLTCRKRQAKVKNRWIEVYEDEAEYADGQILPVYTVLHYPQASAALVVENARGQVLLIRSWRYPIQQEGWEIPAGSVDCGEDPAAAAIREVKEETGLDVNHLVLLCQFYPSNGMSDQKVYVYEGKAEESEFILDEREIEEARWFAPEVLHQMLNSGQIQCGISQLGLRTWLMKRAETVE
ncbi:NUDIX hydrolase [Holdemania massiliensis]|uniref:NUDIX hydrolase n=1 Tax=Holdemania massiliensis TaxID=1468449 RepID=UPI00267507FB|nr:NUDIX hydrolase [Holdemania massiliensis]